MIIAAILHSITARKFDSVSGVHIVFNLTLPSILIVILKMCANISAIEGKWETHILAKPCRSFLEFIDHMVSVAGVSGLISGTGDQVTLKIKAPSRISEY